MHIAAITQHGVAGWPTLKWGQLTPGLNALYGPPRSGKSTTVGLLAQTLFGKAEQCEAFGSRIDAPPGEVLVEGDLGRYRVRRYCDEQGFTRLTVAGFDGAAVDAATMRRLVGSLSPTVLGPLCAISFREPPEVATLLSAQFARGFDIIERGSPLPTSRRTAELTARRDLLAQELESRLAGERQVSKDLELRCRELDRLIRTAQEKVAAIEQSLQAAETALAETDARLRYRRLEINVGRQVAEADPESQMPGDAGQHVLRLRAMLAELAQREAGVRAQRAQIHVSQPQGDASMRTTRDWLAVGRQLAADLAGEVARLARATASQQCVCRDAHPRLRPISETIERQLDVLGCLVEEQESALEAARLDAEISHLADSQVALQRQVDHLLERIHSERQTSTISDQIAGHSRSTFSAADAEQLESRRLELEQQRFNLANELRAHGRALRDLQAQRETVERQRASLLSARSIEHVQRELASVQQKLEQAATLCGDFHGPAFANDVPARASDFLAQLTDGGLVRLTLVEQGRRACVVNRAGQTLRVESLTTAERDLVYTSLCLALHSAARRQGVRLPLVLDDPFERLDARSAAALAAVLDDFSRQGHQVVVFTGQQWAAERLASVGAAVRDIVDLRVRRVEDRPGPGDTLPEVPGPARPRVTKKSKLNRRKARRPRRTMLRDVEQSVDDTSKTDHSDAA